MAREPRVVAELGRPETPEETAERKAAFSQAYRGSQTTRNLIAALLATMAVVLVIVLSVPRGEAPPRGKTDVAAIAKEVADAESRTVLVPEVPSTWIANGAAVEGDDVRAWTIVYVPANSAGYLRVAQGFDADAAWTTRVLRGANAAGTVTIDGVEWTTYDIPDPERAGNVTVAMSTVAGPDTILIYGTADDKNVKRAASGIADQVRALTEEAG